MDVKTHESVINYVKSEILSGNLKKGGKLLPERELAKRIGVSRTSVREGLRILQMLGVIESVQGGGNYITGNIEKSITETLSMMFLLQQTDGRQISELRDALENKAIELAIENITDERIKELEAILSEMETTRDESRAAKLDKDFHYAIIKASNNALLNQMLGAISHLIDSFIYDIRHSIIQHESNKTRLIEIHKGILAGIKSRDLKAAQAALKKHGRIIKENLSNL